MLTKNNQSNQLLKEAQKLGVLCKNCKNGIITKNNCFCPDYKSWWYESSN